MVPAASPWTCWVCGATHTKTGKPLSASGWGKHAHLQMHGREGLVRPAAPAKRRKGATFFVLTREGRAFVERRQMDLSPARPPALPRAGTMARRVYDAITEYPGVRLVAVEIADECGLPLRKASAFAHHLAKRSLVQIETGGRGRQAEFWVDA